MNKLLIFQFICIVLIRINYGQQNFTKYSVTELPYNPKLLDIPIRNVTQRGPIPKYVNWVERGFNTPVLNQGACDDCYAFSSMGAIEAHYFIETRKFIKGSEQSIVDCTKQTGNKGCSGGWSSFVFDFAYQKGIALDQDYPYVHKEQHCQLGPGQYNIKIDTYYRIAPGDEQELKRAVAEVGPVAASMDSSNPSFKNYNGDYVYYEPNCKTDKFTHEVLIVGYGTTNDGKDYWLVKSSWGPNWGIRGYMKIARNANNHCGIATNPVYPVGIKVVRR